jgi:hypothetical protein
MGIDPLSLGHFEVRAFKVQWITKTLTDAEYKAKKAETKLSLGQKKKTEIAPTNKHHLWDARKVDKDSFKKSGINYAVG